MNKKIIYALFSLLGFASCSQESSLPVDSNLLPGDPLAITLSGDFGEIGGGVTPDTRASVDGSQSLSLYFARRDKSTSGNTWPSYGTTALSGTRTAGSGNQTITFSTSQYYPMEKGFGNTSSTSYNETRFIGWFPQAASFSGNVVKINVDGVNDIMLSNEVTGSYTSQFTSSQNQLTFSHQLAKVSVQVKAADAQASTMWGTVTAIKVKNQPITCDITLPTTGNATVGWTGSTALLSLEGMSTKTLTTNYQACGTALVKPTTDKNLTLEVTTLKGGARDVTVSLASGTFAAGTAYTISLDFKSAIIAPSASVTAWGTGSNVNSDL